MVAGGQVLLLVAGRTDPSEDAATGSRVTGFAGGPLEESLGPVAKMISGRQKRISLRLALDGCCRRSSTLARGLIRLWGPEAGDGPNDSRENGQRYACSTDAQHGVPLLTGQNRVVTNRPNYRQSTISRCRPFGLSIFASGGPNLGPSLNYSDKSLPAKVLRLPVFRRRPIDRLHSRNMVARASCFDRTDRGRPTPHAYGTLLPLSMLCRHESTVRLHTEAGIVSGRRSRFPAVFLPLFHADRTRYNRIGSETLAG